MPPTDNPFLNDAAHRMLPSGNSGPILAWIKECVNEGEALMQVDPVWNEIDKNMEYILGRQKAKMVTQDRPAYTSHVVLNETRRTHQRHRSALTDIKPVYAFRTPNPSFQSQALLLNNLTTVWWVNTFADLELASGVSYASAAGAGDLVLDYDPAYGPMGDMTLSARDARDTIPIRATRSGTLQNWYGCILREAHSINVLRAMYPQKLELLKQSASPWGGGIFTKIMGSAHRILGGGATTTLSGLAKSYTNQRFVTGNEIILYKAYLNDPSINTTDRDIPMGKPGTSWFYTVRPGDRLYPRKRLIVCTEAGILYDGPNPYWHGMFPVTRLKLIHIPWSFFGVPLIDAQVGSGLADATNDVINAMLDKIRQTNRPPMQGNARVPDALLRGFDPLKPNARIKTNGQIGQDLEVTKIPELPAYTMEFLQFLRTAQHELTGDATLDALMAAAANQSFDPESIEAWMNALSPELKLEGRQVEQSLRELADMQKANIFQFYDVKRRMQVLGDAGTTLQDFDYDPGNLIPAMGAGEKGYLPELDANQDMRDRAQFFLKLFTFYVTPNSLLALNAQAEKLKYTMMMRAGICDVWTFWEKMEVPNAGEPPVMMLPMSSQPSPEEMALIAAGQVPGSMIDPSSGQALQLRKPLTITERLQAQAMLGLGMNESSVGRKASGQTQPGVEVQHTQDGGQRIKMTESPKDHHPRPGQGSTH